MTFPFVLRKRAISLRTAVLCLMIWSYLVDIDLAEGDRLPERKATLSTQGGFLSLTMGFLDYIGPEFRARLKSGFPLTVLMKVYLYNRKGGHPITVKMRKLEAVYDLWEERYTLVETMHRKDKRSYHPTDKIILDRLSSFWKFPLIKQELLKKGERYFVAVHVDINPIRPEIMEEVKRWIKRPYRQHDHMGRGGAGYFGSFVSIFVNPQVSHAQKTFRLRSQDFQLSP